MNSDYSVSVLTDLDKVKHSLPVLLFSTISFMGSLRHHRIILASIPRIVFQVHEHATFLKAQWALGTRSTLKLAAFGISAVMLPYGSFKHV